MVLEIMTGILVGRVTMTAVICCIVLGSVLFIMSVVLFCGKGSFLIAGYNTASEKEKEQYDEKKLCRSASGVLLAASVLVFTIAYCGYRVESGLMAEKDMLLPAGITSAILLASVGAGMVYMNKCCKKERPDDRND